VIHLDTSFAIDLLREITRNEQGPAQTLLLEHSEETVGISVFAVCELLMGAELSAKPALEMERIRRFCGNVHVDFPNEHFAPAFAKHYARQERLGRRVATMDLLIATSAILAGAALVTRNTKDFARLSALKLIGY
jgi:tRNA(fMet)-specific endonuclease VapC